LSIESQLKKVIFYPF